MQTAVADAASGWPTTVATFGGPGTGKSALLDEIAVMAVGFRILDSYGSEAGEHSPYDLLAQWDIDPPGSRVSPMVAAQSLRRLVDSMATEGPIMLRVDDLHEADPESVEALVWLLRRASGDRLLLVAGYRPLRAGQHPAWRRWLQGRRAVHQIELTGLTETQAAELVSTLRPTLTAAAAHRLWLHTEGNPLYLNALLREHDTDALTSTTQLPAPAEYAHLIEERLARVSSQARALARATCVLGDSWVPLFHAVGVAGLPGGADAVQELLDQDLLWQRVGDRGTAVRAPHALLRAAVLQAAGRPQLRVLHARAAAAATETAVALEHRVAAADNYDEQLAVDLDDQAESLHTAGQYRAAARLRRSAAALSAGPLDRRRRSIEAVIEQLLGRDTDISSADRAAIEADDPAGRVATGLRLILLGRWYQAYRLLVAGEGHHDDDSIDLDLPSARTGYRLGVLTAWAGIGSGAPTVAVAGHLAAAAGFRSQHAHAADPAMLGYENSPWGYVQERVGGFDAALASVADLPSRAAEASVDKTVDLARRGVLRLRIGQLADAVGDLDEVQRRFQGGMIDITDGGFLARHAQALWWQGSWDRARAAADLALADSARFVQPIAATAASVLPSSTGDFEAADHLLGSARSFLAAQHWEEGRRSLVVAEVIRLHAGGVQKDQAAYAGRNAEIFAQLAGSASVATLEAMHAALACIWAGDLGRAASFNDRVINGIQSPRWARPVNAWLTGLIEQRRGAPATALRHLDEAVDSSTTDIPFYRAHIFADHGRAAAQAGRADAAASLHQAREIYRSLGAVPYLETVQPPPEPRPAGLPAPRAEPQFQWRLSERERQVLVLVVAGLSYAQVSAELFITQSTVAYHLSHMYAKTDVTSRHQLTALVRQAPASFGLLPHAIGLPV